MNNAVPTTQNVPQNRMNLNEFQALSSQPSFFYIWITTTSVLFVSVFLLKWLFNPKRKSKVIDQLHRKVTTVINEKEGIRVMNQDYKPTHNRKVKPHIPVLANSICEAILSHTEEFPDTPVFGSHATPDKPYEWITWSQFRVMFTEFGSGLIRQFGIECGSQTMVGIYGINSLQWVVGHFGLLFYSNVIVPIYSTLGEEAIVHIVKLTKQRVCICQNEDLSERFVKVLLAQHEKGDTEVLANLRGIVLMTSTSASSLEHLRTKYGHKFEFHMMDDIRELGRKELLPYQLPKPDNMYALNFTSGTTGVPKGVIITCKMYYYVIKSILGSTKVLNSHPSITWMDETDVYFSFLPLAHVLEQSVLAAILFSRGRVGFYSGDISKLMDDITCLKPTILAMVPRLLIRIHESFLSKLKEKHVPRFLLDWAVSSKLKRVTYEGDGTRSTIWDKVLFRPLQEKLGGNLRLVISGSAACPSEVLNFCRAALGASIHIGYGSTETGGPVSLTYNDDIDPTHIGAPIQGTQVKLGDVPDMDLYPSRNNGCTRGEILVRGESCTPGYYQDPEKNKELFTEDGWLRTGDVGEWDNWGRLKIVDRCKNMFKLSQGEYVAPDRVENIYLTSPLIQQVFLDGHPDSSYAVALVLPDYSQLAERVSASLAKSGEARLANTLNVDELRRSSLAKKLILSELTNFGKANKLAGFELAKKVSLIAEPFSIEQGLLTATLKPVRARIRRHFEKEINEMYAEGL